MLWDKCIRRRWSQSANMGKPAWSLEGGADTPRARSRRQCSRGSTAMRSKQLEHPPCPKPYHCGTDGASQMISEPISYHCLSSLDSLAINLRGKVPSESLAYLAYSVCTSNCICLIHMNFSDDLGENAIIQLNILQFS
jgi:hypothetical protein